LKTTKCCSDYWLSWYELHQPAVDEVIQRAQPVYEVAAPIARQIADQCTLLANKLLLQATALWKEFLRSGWPRICQFVTATKEAIAPLWARAVTESAPLRASAWAKIEHVAAPAMAHASTMHGQLVQLLGSVQKVLVYQLGLSMDTLFTYLVLQEGPPRLVSATRFMKEHPEETVVYIEGTVATLLMAMAVLFLLKRPASSRAASRSTQSKAKKEKAPHAMSKRESRGLKKKLS
jgi:hypothetical protein